MDKKDQMGIWMVSVAEYIFAGESMAYGHVYRRKIFSKQKNDADYEYSGNVHRNYCGCLYDSYLSEVQ